MTFEVELTVFCNVMQPWSYSGQRVECGDLKKNITHVVGYLNTCFQVDLAVWGGLGGSALLEEVSHGVRLWDYTTSTSLQFALCLSFWY